MLVTMRVAFRRGDEEWWTLLERTIDASSLEKLASETAEAVLHAKNEIEKTEK